MSVVAFVFARGGSKGVPQKNLRKVGGLSLLAHSIQCAKSVSEINRVMVSTDDPKIAEEAEQCGAEVPFLRPAELARDDSPERAAWCHALQSCQELGINVECFVSLPTTAPLRAREDVLQALALWREQQADLVVSVTAARRSPYFNMVTMDHSGKASLVIPSEVSRRQDAPRVYDMTTAVYVARPEFVRSHRGFWEGKTFAIEIPEARAMDIDTELDLEIAEFLYQRQKEKS